MSGALGRGAVWSEVKEEGRRGSTRRGQAVYRPGGHGRNTAPRRSAHAPHVDGWVQLAAKGRKPNLVDGAFVVDGAFDLSRAAHRAMGD
jgi:hypothetical protein